MRIAFYAVFAAIMSTGLTFGQALSHAQVKVVTVCEVLGDDNRYADTDVAVVGRMMHSVSLIDHYEFLSQDQCAHPVIAHGHTWPNVIQVMSSLRSYQPFVRPQIRAPTKKYNSTATAA